MTLAFRSSLRRLPGSSRAEQLAAIRLREARMKPIVERAMRTIRAASPLHALRSSVVAGHSHHPEIERAVRHAWHDAAAALRLALSGPVHKQDGALDPTTAEALAERQIGDLIEGLAARGADAVQAQLEALALLMDQGPDAALGPIAEAAGLTAKQTEAVARFLQARLAEGIAARQAARLARAYAARLAQQRAALIARTEAVRFTSALVLERGRAVGGLVVKLWVSARDENVDEICEALDDGEEVPINEPFEALGFRFDGPPAHPGCRCLPEIYRVAA
jgi:hypothetical protein